ncbi:hypothetical protein [Azospirillum sp. SYSU D00513]|uniref:hypothetical protein n=1 Tax=Azospirillum sp. SYSU D00513 TaxID=2812561 RepID=UPI001A972022|nr:hypothetical protein [Azospirillum sp. SYSU D00513]
MDEFAVDHVRAFIATARVAEMKAQGWRAVAHGQPGWRGQEGALLMEGPAVGGRGPARLGNILHDLFDDLVAAAIARADMADELDRMRKAA